MKKLLAIALLTAGCALPAPAVIVGASIGYLTDSKEPYYAARAGLEFNSTESLSQLGEFEIGYTSDAEGGAKASLVPVTLNYRAQFAGTGKIAGYAGFGAGVARTNLRVPGSGLPWLSDHGTSFAAQGFAGVTFKFSPAASLDLGARYIWIDDVKLQAWGVKAEVGDDLALEAGLHFKF